MTETATVTLPDGRTAEVSGPDRAAVLRRIDELRGTGSEVDKSPFDAGPSREKLVQHSEYEPPQVLGLQPPGADIAATGVDVTTGAPVGARLPASFAKDQLSAVAYFEAILETRVRRGPDSDQPEYLREDPVTGKKRWTLIDESAFVGKDIGELGKVLPLLGAAAGGYYSGGTNIGMAVGAGAGEVIRLGIGEALGVNDVSAETYAVEGAKVTAIDALLGWGITKTMKAYATVRRMFKPTGAEAEEAQLALAMMESRHSEKLAADVEAMARRLDENARLRPTTAQLSQDEYLLAIEQSTLRGDMRNAVEVSRREVENESTLEVAFDAITKQADDAAASYKQAQSTIDIAGAKVAREGDAAADDLALTTRGAKEPISSIETIDPQESGRALRGFVVEARKEAKRIETAAQNRYKEAYGWDGHAASEVQIPRTPRFQKFVKGVNQEKLDAWFKSTKAGKEKLVPKTLLGDEPLDLHQLEVSLRELKRWQRINGKNQVASDTAGFDIGRMIGELEQLKRDTLSPELLNLSEMAQQASKNRIKTFDKGALRTIIRKDGDEYLLDDTQVFGYVLASNDRQAAQHFMKIVSQDPGAVVATKKSLWSFYKSETAPDGYVKPALHNAFMKKHNNTINAMFTPAEIKRMNSLGDIGRVVERSIKEYDNFVTGLEKTFAGKIKNTDPESMATLMFSKNFSARDVKKLMDMLDNYGVGDSTREVVGTYVKSYAMRGGTLSLSGLDRLLDPARGNITKLTHIYGDDYIKDLAKISGVANMIRQRAQRSLVPGKTNAFTDLMRVIIAPPLTRKGRAQSLLVNVRYDAANRALSNALLNPNELRRIVALENTQAGTSQAMRVLGQLYGSYALTDVEIEDVIQQ